jgi:hypothetical protein
MGLYTCSNMIVFLLFTSHFSLSRFLISLTGSYLKSDIHSQLALRSDPVIRARPSSLPVCRRLCQLSNCTVFNEDGKHPLRFVDTIGSPWTCLSFQKEPCILIAFNSDRVDTVSTRDIRDLNSRPSSCTSVVSSRTNRLLTLQFLTSHISYHISSHISASSHLSVLTPPSSHISTFSHLSLLTSLPSHHYKATPTSPKKHPFFLPLHPSTSITTPTLALGSPLTLYVAKGLTIMVSSLGPNEAWQRTLDRKSRNRWNRRSKIIKKPEKKKHILNRTIKTKLESNRELSESERIYILSTPRGQHKDYILSKTNHGLLDACQISELDSMFDLRRSTSVSNKHIRTQRELSIHHAQMYYYYWSKTHKRLHNSKSFHSKRLSHERSQLPKRHR